MTSYPDYSRLEDIYYYLGDCHFKMRQYDQAVPFFTKVITDYPGIALAKEATKRLLEIEKAKAILKDSKAVKDKKG
jgi:outer membrane protein assembly factor BamD